MHYYLLVVVKKVYERFMIKQQPIVIVDEMREDWKSDCLVNGNWEMSLMMNDGEDLRW